PAPQGTQWRKLNFLKVIQKEVELTEINKPSPLVRSPAIRQYFHYRVQYQIHESFVSSKYNRNLANRDYVVTDDTKVVGYLINGYFFDFKQIYEPGFMRIK
ncbi:MAG: hypothetical protein KGL53_10380, partial [Elusimicrobia bacterium]|nr:hypothetical protein [Elusimicrobiota bacterium]